MVKIHLGRALHRYGLKDGKRAITFYAVKSRGFFMDAWMKSSGTEHPTMMRISHNGDRKSLFNILFFSSECAHHDVHIMMLH